MRASSGPPLGTVGSFLALAPKHLSDPRWPVPIRGTRVMRLVSSFVQRGASGATPVCWLLAIVVTRRARLPPLSIRLDVVDCVARRYQVLLCGRPAPPDLGLRHLMSAPVGNARLDSVDVDFRSAGADPALTAPAAAKALTCARNWANSSRSCRGSRRRRRAGSAVRFGRRRGSSRSGVRSGGRAWSWSWRRGSLRAPASRASARRGGAGSRLPVRVVPIPTLRGRRRGVSGCGRARG